MNLTWRIREAILEDAVGLKSCMESAYVAYKARMDGVRLPPMDVDYSLEIKNYPSWVVESEGCILAGLIMTFEKNEASIANIAVDPKCQGQGIGGGLISFAESKAKKNGYSELRLATHILLVENISLYHHLGWEEIERDKVRVFMKKKI